MLPPDPRPADPARIARQAEMLGNRVAKTARHLARWARREGVTCYRLYDRDIPEIRLTVDRYEDHLVVAEFSSSHEAEDSEERLAALAAAAGAALDVPTARIHTKRRARMRGASQYEVRGRSERLVVHEGGHQFWVNLEDYVDTGLFLDHRLTRARIEREARGARVLNLFAYTGSFTVYAAAGGASHTTSVDLSATYLDWIRDNLALNQLGGPAHALVRADARAWLAAPARTPFDLVILDPPSFSNSKKMQGVLDLARDHPELVADALRHLRPGGALYFSTNHRSLRFEPEAVAGVATVEDLSRATLPPDFRDPKIHRLWRIVKA